SRVWGSSSSDWGGPVTVGAAGNIHVALNAWGSFDGQPYAGQFDNALCKFNLHGQRLWTQMWGTPEMEFAKAIALDEARGCLYVSGETMGTLGGQTNAGHYDACLTRLSWQGSQEWVRLWGTVDEERTFGVGVDTAGCVYATGYTINPMDGQPFNGLIDCFLTKFSPEGDRLWTRLWGSTDADEPRGGLVVDTQGFVYVVGRTDGSFGSQTNNGGRDAFVTKFSPAGDQVWTRLLGSGSTEEGRGIAFGPQGHLYISGRTWGSFGGQTNQGGQDFFVVKLTTDGDEIWTRVLGSPYDDWGAQVAVDGEGNAYLLGGTKDPFYGHEPIGDYDPVACKIGPSGDLIWTHRWGSTNYENTAGIAADTWGNVYASGFTLGSFDGQTNSGYYDYEVFLTRLISEGGAQPIGPVADGARSPDIAYAGPPLTMGATHYWRIRFFDPSGQPSFWSEGANWFIYSDGDLDDDGLPDYWEQQHELDPFDDGGNNPDNGPEGDPDSDRFPNSGECIADTDPRSPASLFEVMRLVVGATNVLTFRASTQRLYTVSYSADLMTSNWLDLLVRWPATGEVVSVTDTNGAAHRIYRLGVERP
ncbi:MAG: SBBP repeat-containing protein, partial [Verrucomicrobia bacterium]|nr:SBBP repeat-containing protein [Verrucomicrobiota bacterium]